LQFPKHVLFVLFFVGATQVQGEQSSSPGAEPGFWQKRSDEFASPWTTPARQWLLWGSGVTLALIILEDQIVDPVQDETVENRPLGSASTFGDRMGQLIPNAVYMAGMGLHYYWTKNEVSANRAIDMFKSSAYSGLVTQVLKFMVHEPRPNNTSGNRSYESFPSGHTASAFSFSSTVIAEHGFWPYGALATAMASFTGFSRMNDNKHYVHDVVGGFTLGTVYGFGIAHLRRGEKYQNLESKVSSWQVLPAYSDEIKGVVAQIKF